MTKPHCPPHPEDRLDWPDGTSFDRSEYESFEGQHMSDDFTVVPVSQRMDHLDYEMSTLELCDQLMIALQDMECPVVMRCVAREGTAEAAYSGLEFADEFSDALKKVTLDIARQKIPDLDRSHSIVFIKFNPGDAPDTGFPIAISGITVNDDKAWEQVGADIWEDATPYFSSDHQETPSP
ncbi:MAG: hypothetical protein ABJN42_13455 [Roseibium sp.]|uniref:hypothetical protein n=1 Tax=Roseibium sp. TaxID=1936156 RepID=UPI003299DBF7